VYPMLRRDERHVTHPRPFVPLTDGVFLVAHSRLRVSVFHFCSSSRKSGKVAGCAFSSAEFNKAQIECASSLSVNIALFVRAKLWLMTVT
jgi:hypothetical protein